MKFNEFELDERLLRAVDDLGFVECTEVQERSLEHTLAWRDVTAQSQTGTGKTAAFLLTIYQHFLSKPELEGRQALVIAPTRELAVQIEEEAKLIGKYLPYRTGSIYGGVGYGPQEKMLRDSVEIIVGTPGRLIDLSKSGKLDFGNFAIVVIDEADRLFDMGFYPDIRYMLKRTPPKEKRLTLLFSATLSTSVRNISWQYMNDPAEIEVAPEHITVQEVDQVLYHVARDEKISLLLGLLKKEQPENALIFTNTKRAAELIAKKLKGNGYPCEFIMGDVPQRKRLRIINNLKSGAVPYLVATDVAARGLHIEDLDLVVNYDLPEDVESYVHRIGRTARAGKSGKAVSLACERFVFSLEAIESFVGFKIPVGQLSDDLFVADQSRVSMRDLQYHSDGRGSHGGRSQSGRSGGRSRAGSRPHGARHGGSRSGDGVDQRTRDRRKDQPKRDEKERQEIRARSEPERVRSPQSASPDQRRSDKQRSDTQRSSGKKNRDRRPRKDGEGRDGSRRSQSDRSKRGRPSKAASMDERLEYYREKYGEDFQHAGHTGGSGDSPGGRRGRQKSRSKQSSRARADSKQSESRPPANEQAKAVKSGTDREAAGDSEDGKKERKSGFFGKIARLFSNDE